MMSYFNEKLYYIVGSQYNIKITTPVDYYVFRGFLSPKKNLRIEKMNSVLFNLKILLL